MSPIARTLLAWPTLDTARSLVGARLVRDGPSPDEEPRVGRIVEVEAYIGEDDLASHARFGRTARNGVMYGPPGIAYVYLVYGMYDCLNIVTEPAGRPAAVLVRAVEPIAGLGAMRAGRAAVAARRRKLDPEALAAERDRIRRLPVDRLARGPGLVAAAFGVDRSLTGIDLLDPRSALRIEPPASTERPPRVLDGPRIGIAYAGSPWTERPWRFVDATSTAVSRGPAVIVGSVDASRRRGQPPGT